VDSELRNRCPRITAGVSQHCFSGHFDRCSSTPITLPRINIGADVWGKLGIMTGVIIADARLLCTSGGVCVIAVIVYV
jgi:hypothetical protein